MPQYTLNIHVKIVSLKIRFGHDYFIHINPQNQRT
jgi:hypothetical protein